MTDNLSMKSYMAFNILVICVTAGNAITWKDCGSKFSFVKDVQVTGCESSKVCDLHKGQNVTFTVDFIASAGSEKAESLVQGIVEPGPPPQPPIRTNACTDPNSGLQCPLKKSKSYSFHPYIYISCSYPKVRVIVKWELQNGDGQDIFCVMVPAQITYAKELNDQNKTQPKYSNKTPKLFQLL